MRTLSRFAVVLIAFSTGCTPALPPPVPAASYDADAIAAKLLERCDADRDGFIDPSEAEKCPALKAAFALFDANQDNKISRDEVSARIARYPGSPIVAASVHLSVAGQPAAGYKVTLTPDPAFGSLSKTAICTTDEAGTGRFKLEGQEAFGVPAGLYEVTVVDAAGMPVGDKATGRELFESGRGGSGTIDLHY